MRKRRFTAWVCVSILLPGFAAASVWTLRFAWADYVFANQRLESALTAVWLVPDRAGYWAGLSAALAEDKPAQSLLALKRAAVLEAFNSEYLIDLGLRAESKGDLRLAESYLLKAAKIDRLYLPRWSLTNFYFRRGNQSQFWNWAKQAAGMVYGDPSPLFQLCWQITQDGDQISRNLEIRRPEIQVRYLSFLLGGRHSQAIAREALRAVVVAREEDRPIVFAACERLLRELHPQEAILLWNKLRPDRIARSATVTNSGFAQPLTSSGFDWRYVDFDGVTVSDDESRHALKVSFSGSQREDCEPLWQYVAVKGGAKYRVRSQMQANGSAAASGLEWRIIDAANDNIIAASSMSSFCFTAPQHCRLIRLAFGYRRVIGTRRIEGDVFLKSVLLALDLGEAQ